MIYTVSDKDIVNGRLREDLHAEITYLDFGRCTNLQSLPKGIPAWITTLNLSGCTDIQSLPEDLPAGIRRLHLKGCTGLRSLPNIPAKTSELDLRGCTGLRSLPEDLPKWIQSLDLSGCTGLQSLPDKLPEWTGSLNLSGCTGLRSLPDVLPERMRYLNLSGCTGLRSLPDIPTGVSELDLSGCTSLIFTEDLINQLSTLEENAIVHYPNHFSKDAQVAESKAKLEQAILIYKANNQDNPTPTSISTLLHRFLTEGIGQRNGIREIVAATSPILNAITKNPDHLEWIEEIATQYLGACVNQPVAGWSEISAAMSIALAPTIEEKIEATKYLRALEAIRQFIYDLPENFKPGQGLEAEFRNALFCKVHKKLLDEGDIKQPWLAAPKSIAYEVMIRDFLTPEMTEVACAYARLDFEKTSEQVADYLCAGVHQEIWGKFAFPDEVAGIKKHYQEEREFLALALEINAIEDRSARDK